MPHTAWQKKANALREAADTEGDPLARQTLLVLAEDCDTIAAEIEASGQPGKPKPPGNPPRPIPVPPAEQPPPLSARK